MSPEYIDAWYHACNSSTNEAIQARDELFETGISFTISG